MIDYLLFESSSLIIRYSLTDEDLTQSSPSEFNVLEGLHSIDDLEEIQNANTITISFKVRLIIITSEDDSRMIHLVGSLDFYELSF